MRIRCPACQTVHPDPSRVFTCEGCGRHLAWRPRPWLLRPEQQVLFVPEGTVEPLTLDLEADEPPRARETRPATEPSVTAAATVPPPVTSLSRAIALVTVLMTDDADQDMYTAVIADPSAEPITDLAFDAAWLAASAVRYLDWQRDGAGAQWLREMATFAARE